VYDLERKLREIESETAITSYTLSPTATQSPFEEQSSSSASPDHTTREKSFARYPWFALSGPLVGPTDNIASLGLSMEIDTMPPVFNLDIPFLIEPPTVLPLQMGIEGATPIL